MIQWSTTFLSSCCSGPGRAATLPICFTAGRKPPALWDCLPKVVGIRDGFCHVELRYGYSPVSKLSGGRFCTRTGETTDFMVPTLGKPLNIMDWYQWCMLSIWINTLRGIWWACSYTVYSMYIVVVTVRSPTLGNPSLTCQFCLPKLAHLELSCIPESEDAWFYHQQKQGPNTLAPPGETSEFIQHQTFQPGVHRLLRGLGIIISSVSCWQYKHHTKGTKCCHDFAWSTITKVYNSNILCPFLSTKSGLNPLGSRLRWIDPRLPAG